MSNIHGFELPCNGTRKRPSSKIVVVTPKEQPMPEAPCSVNLFFEVEGYGRAQATGRGATAQDAAANLTATIAATRAALAPVPVAPPAPVEPPVRPLTQHLAGMLACGLDKALKRGDMGLVERLSKAAVLVLSNAVQPGNREGLMTVRSLARPEVWYDVEHGQCTCPDWRKHAQAGETYFCKHGLAVLMVLRVQEPQ